jgi:glucosamine--fructose-6-phosphate aminotransferase (isomerizing)
MRRWWEDGNGATGIEGTPVGDPWRSTTRTHPHLGTTASSRLTASSRNFAELKAELVASTGHTVFSGETDTEVAALSASNTRRPVTSPSPCLATSSTGCAARSPARATADQPGIVVGARQNSPLVIGLGDGELHSARMSRPSSSTPAARHAIGQDQL